MSDFLPPEVAAEGDGHGVVAAFIDSGINFEHPHLAIKGRGFTIDRSSSVLEGATDRFGHGTATAALFHALAPKAELIGINVLGPKGTTDSARLAKGLDLARALSAHVVCVPLGTKKQTQALEDATRSLLDRGVTIFAALGEPDVRPASFPGVFGVGVEQGVDVAFRGDRLVADGSARAAPGFRTNFRGASLSAARATAAWARFVSCTELAAEALKDGFKKLVPVL